MFEFFRKAPKSKLEAPPPFEAPPPAFNSEFTEEYRRAGEKDEDLRELLMRHEEISAFQAAGHGVGDDAREKEKIEEAIAERYAKSVAS